MTEAALPLSGEKNYIFNKWYWSNAIRYLYKKKFNLALPPTKMNV